LTAKQKAIASGVAVFLLSLACCFGITWFIASDYGARLERERIAAEKEKAIETAKEALSKIFSAPVGKKKKREVSDWLTPDKAAMIDGIKVELLEGSLGKLRIKNAFGGESRLSEKAYFQIGIRITNDKDNFVLEYRPRGYSQRLCLLDNFDNSYKQYHGSGSELVGVADGRKLRVDPGKSI